MTTQTFGSPATFGIEICAGQVPESPRIDVFIAGQSVSAHDNTPYIHACITQFEGLARTLESKIDFLKYWHLFAPLRNLTEIHGLIWRGFSSDSDEGSELWSVHAFSWGARSVGDPVVLLVPYFGQLHLTFHHPSDHCNDTCEVHRNLTARVSGVQISRDEIVATLEGAAQALKAIWNAAKPEFAFRGS